MRTLIATTVLLLAGCGTEALPKDAIPSTHGVACNVTAGDVAFAYAADLQAEGRLDVNVGMTLGGVVTYKDAVYSPGDPGYCIAPIFFDSGWEISVDRQARIATIVGPSLVEQETCR